MVYSVVFFSRVSCFVFLVCFLAQSSADGQPLPPAEPTHDVLTCIGSESLLQRDSSASFAHEAAEAMILDQPQKNK